MGNNESVKNELNLKDYSFRYAYNSLPKNKMGEVRKRIKQILNVKSDKAVYDRIAGRTEPKLSEAQAIEQIFKSHGITIVWGAKYEVP